MKYLALHSRWSADPPPQRGQRRTQKKELTLAEKRTRPRARRALECRTCHAALWPLQPRVSPGFEQKEQAAALGVGVESRVTRGGAGKEGQERRRRGKRAAGEGTGKKPAAGQTAGQLARGQGSRRASDPSGRRGPAWWRMGRQRSLVRRERDEAGDVGEGKVKIGAFLERTPVDWGERAPRESERARNAPRPWHFVGSSARRPSSPLRSSGGDWELQSTAI